MPDQDAIDNHLQLLRTHRTALARLLNQQARAGDTNVPAHIMADIDDKRVEIARIKSWLRTQGVPVDDEPNDLATEYRTSAGPLATAQALLAQLPLDSIPPRVRLTVPHRTPISPNRLFVGRDDDLRALATMLKGDATTTLDLVAAIIGLGGIGKTQLAAEFVARYGQFFAGGVFWLSFADPQAIAGEIVAAGVALDLPSFANLKFEDQLARVRQAWDDPTPRLLIFDNCEDEALLDQWRPQPGGTRILITSRHAKWHPEHGVVERHLHVLPRDQSIVLLRRFRPDLAADDPQLDAIAELVGDLPLALHIAGSYLYQNRFGTTPAEYAEALRSTNVLDHVSFQQEAETIGGASHARHVGRTLALSYNQLNPQQPTDALAQQLLAAAACFAPGEPISPALLRATLGDEVDLSTWNQALLRLASLGLIDEGDTPSAQPRLHRLLAALVRGLPSERVLDTAVEQVLLAEAMRLLDAGYPAGFQPILAHLRYVTDRAIVRADQPAAELATALGRYFMASSKYADARLYFDQALALQRQLHGAQHVAVATCLYLLGELLWRQAAFAAGQEQVEAALIIQRTVLGEAHQDTARSLNMLGRLVHEQGKYAEARQAYQQSLDIRTTVCGSIHPETAESLNDLAVLLDVQGDYAAARLLYERALAIREQTRGPVHPDTALSLGNLAGLLKTQGDYAAAHPLFERALAISEQALGPTHPDTALSLGNLAALFRAQADYAAARPLLERALVISEQALGPTHPDTATSLDNLANLFQEQGDYAAARPLYERALAITEQALGPSHPLTANSLGNLALLFQDQGDYAAARPLSERALALREQVLGPVHPDTASSLGNLAGLFQAQGDYAAARPLSERALAISEQALGPTHPKTATSLNNLGTLLVAQGQLAEAQSHLERAVAINRAALGDHHPDTARMLIGLAGLFHARQDHSRAARTLHTAWKILDRTLGKHHPDTRKTLYSLAVVEQRIPAGWRTLKPDVAGKVIRRGPGDAKPRRRT